MSSYLVEHHADIQRMLQEGKSQRAIARELGYPKSTVTDYIAALSSQNGHIDDGLTSTTEHDELPVFTVDLPDAEKALLYPLGDLHIGSPQHEDRLWGEWRRYLNANPDARLIFTGDCFNAAILGSKSDQYLETMTVGQAKRLVIQQLEPLAQAGRLDLIIPGNHENRVWRATGECPLQDVADWLGVRYSPASAVLRYSVGHVGYTAYVRHGTGMSGSSISSLARALERGNSVVQADIYISGHTHNQLAAADNYFAVDDDGRSIRKRRLYVSSGSFVGWERYAAERNYIPGKLGAPRIYLNGTKWDAHVSI